MKKYAVISDTPASTPYFESNTSPKVARAARNMLARVGYKVLAVERVAGVVVVETDLPKE